MRMRLKILALMGGILMTGIVGGCDSKDQAEVEQSFEKVLDIYPTKDLTDFYDMEGYRDSNFDEEDKGTWVLYSSMSIEDENKEVIVSKGMLLRINLNNNVAEGYYFENETGFPDVEEKRYPVVYDQNGFHLTEEPDDIKINKIVDNFQFFIQYGAFENLEAYDNIRKMYNPEVPIYELEYRLTNEDKNVQALRERYDIPTQKAPTLLLSGRGNLDGSSIGYKNIEYDFDKEGNIYFTDSVSFTPSEEEYSE